MELRRGVAAVFALCILSKAFSLPIDALRFGRYGPLNYRHPFLLLRIPTIPNSLSGLNERFIRQNEDLVNNPSPLPLQTEVKTSVPLQPAVTVILPPQGIPPDTTTFSPTTTTLEPKTNEYDKKTEQTASTTTTIPVTHTTEPKPSQSTDEASTAPLATNVLSTNEPNQKTTLAPMNPAVTLIPKPSSYIKQKEQYQNTESIDDLESDDGESIATSSSSSNGGGSNLFSLLNFASTLFPASSGGNRLISNIIRYFLLNNSALIINRRNHVTNSEIDVDYVADLKPPPPPLQRQEDDSSNGSSNSSEDSETNENRSESNAQEVSIEEINTNASKQTFDSNGDASNSDSDEIPGGDGQGGGILGILASLSGGDGQSDLGTLLATVGGIIADLSGDGFDLNAVLGSGLGLLAGLLSEGDENPGSVVASYLLTSLDTITGGGANNNGAFLGNFISKLVKGTSAGVNEEGSEEDKEPMKDSAGFFASFLMSLLGNMSKGSSSGSSSHPW